MTLETGHVTALETGHEEYDVHLETGHVTALETGHEEYDVHLETGHEEYDVHLETGHVTALETGQVTLETGHVTALETGHEEYDVHLTQLNLLPFDQYWFDQLAPCLYPLVALVVRWNWFPYHRSLQCHCQLSHDVDCARAPFAGWRAWGRPK